MDVYKLGKTMKNQKIEIQLSLHQLKEESDEMQHTLKQRKELAIQQNDTHYQEEHTSGLFEDRNLEEFDVVIIDLMEKNGALNKEIGNLKIE